MAGLWNVELEVSILMTFGNRHVVSHRGTPRPKLMVF